ncbi:MAG: hypothetical protein ACK50P_17305, partial [Planctomycetaceae bacterium]
LQGCVNASSHDRRGSLECGPDSLFSIDKIATSRGERSASTSIPDPTLRPHGTDRQANDPTLERAWKPGTFWGCNADVELLAQAVNIGHPHHR